MQYADEADTNLQWSRTRPVDGQKRRTAMSGINAHDQTLVEVGCAVTTCITK